MLYQLIITHKPRKRHSFPWTWQRVGGGGDERLVTLTESGEYWFEAMQRHQDTLALALTNIATGEIKSWKK